MSLTLSFVAQPVGAGGSERDGHGHLGGGSAERLQPGAGRHRDRRGGEESGDAAGESHPVPGLCELHLKHKCVCV